MKIRLEEEKDYYEVETLTREAFWNVYRPGCFEHFVLHQLRKDPCFVNELDYVLEEEGKIIAHIAYAKGKLTLEDGNIQDILLFGPVSVLPAYQKQGYGEQLIRYTMQKAQELGYNEIVITGNPEYYHKYGFESASKYHIYYEGMSVEEEAAFFMIHIFNKNMKVHSGIYSDPECYFVDEKEVDIFDQLFPAKMKEIREGQL